MKVSNLFRKRSSYLTCMFDTHNCFMYIPLTIFVSCGGSPSVQSSHPAKGLEARDSQKSGSSESVDDSLVSWNNTFIADCTDLEEHRD